MYLCECDFGLSNYFTVTFSESYNIYGVHTGSAESDCFLMNEQWLFCLVPDFFGNKTLNGFAESSE